MGKLPIFISWSKPRSEAVAKALRDWLPQVLQATDPWLSKEIPAGRAWFNEIGVRLQKSNFAIVCVTAENQREPWLNFEAGACSKLLGEAQCCPYLLGLKPADVGPPLGQFQSKPATKEGTIELLRDVNKALSENGIDESALSKVFERSWPDLDAALKAIAPANDHPEPRRVDDMVREILEIVRGGLRRPRFIPNNATLLARGLMVGPSGELLRPLTPDDRHDLLELLMPLNEAPSEHLTDKGPSKK
jgi:hypothetical protein